MTDPSPLTSSPPKSKFARSRITILLFALIVIVVAVMQRQIFYLEEWVTNSQTRIQSLEDQIKTVQADTPAAAAPQKTGEGAPINTADLAHMQSDLAALSNTISALQTEVKATGGIAAQTKQSAQASIASLLAFFQLREAVLGGHKFTDELNGMKSAAKGNDAATAVLGRLDPYADTGVATPAVLSNQLMALEASAQAAADKAGAQGWKDRVIAGLKGLISIRSLHNGAGAGFAAMESALAAGDVSAALEAMKALPSEAQDALKDWRAHAEIRVAVEAALHDITNLLGAQGGP